MRSLLLTSLFLGLVVAAIPAAAQDAAVPPQIETEDVPPIPEELTRTLARYDSFRSASFAGWSPVDNGILIRTRFGNASQLHRVYRTGGRREQITFFREPVSGRFLPEAEDDSVLISMSAGGSEQNQIYLLDRDDDVLTLLTDGESRNLMGPVTEDGSLLAYTSNRRNGRDTDIYTVDPRDPDTTKLVFETDGEYWYATDWSPDQSRLLISRYVSINEGYLAVLDLETGESRDLPLDDEQTYAIGDAEFSPDGKAVYLSTDLDSEFLRLARLDLETGELSWLADDIEWDVEDIEVHRETRRVAFTVNENGVSRLYVLDAGERSEVPLLPGILRGLEFSPDGSQLGFTLYRPDAPGDAYTTYIGQPGLLRWTFSETGGLDADEFVSPVQIQFPSFDGQIIPAYYYQPKTASADEPAPVLILIHGGPESQYRPYLSGITQYYCNVMGLAVIAPNVRGSEGYGKSYLKLDNGPLRENSVRDIGALLDWIDDQPELDASRIAVSGGSYGGYMVLSSLAHYPERIRAGIDIVGIANFITFLENTSAYRRDLRRVEYGDERDPEMRAHFEKINPTALVDQIDSALLVAHGVNDPRVPFSEAEQIAEKVREAGKPVWTVYAANEGHGFRKKDNADYLRAVQVMFLQKFLLD